MKRRKCQTPFCGGRVVEGEGNCLPASLPPSLPVFLPLLLPTLSPSLIPRLSAVCEGCSVCGSNAAAPASSSASSASDIHTTTGAFCVSTGAIVDFKPFFGEKGKHHGHDGQQRATRRKFQRLAEEELASDCHCYISGARYVKAHVCWENDTISPSMMQFLLLFISPFSLAFSCPHGWNTPASSAATLCVRCMLISICVEFYNGRCVVSAVLREAIASIWVSQTICLSQCLVMSQSNVTRLKWQLMLDQCIQDKLPAGAYMLT